MTEIPEARLLMKKRDLFNLTAVKVQGHGASGGSILGSFSWQMAPSVASAKRTFRARKPREDVRDWGASFVTALF